MTQTVVYTVRTLSLVILSLLLILLVSTSARGCCDREYLLVGWFVRSFVMISRKVKSPIFMKFGADVHHLPHISLLTFQGQGQSSRSKQPY